MVRNATVKLAAIFGALAVSVTAQPSFSISAVAGIPLRTGVAATSAYFRSPTALASDKAGGFYFANGSSQVVHVSRTGIVDAIYGSPGRGFGGDGGLANGPAVRFGYINGLAVDLSGNLYIADSSNWRIRKVDSATGILTTFAGNGQQFQSTGDDGPATAASLYVPGCVAVDSFGNVYICESYKIRRIGASTGIITTFANVSSTVSLAFGANRNVYAASGYNSCVLWQISADGVATNLISRFGCPVDSGNNGPVQGASFTALWAIAANSTGDLYVATATELRKINAAGVITGSKRSEGGNWCCVGGQAEMLPGEGSLDLDPSGALLYASRHANVVFKIDTTTNALSIVAGTTDGLGDGGPASSAALDQPAGLAISPSGDILIADPGSIRVRKIEAQTGTISTFVGTGAPGGHFSDGGRGDQTSFAPQSNYSDAYTLVQPITFDPAGNLYMVDFSATTLPSSFGFSRLWKVDPNTKVTTSISVPSNMTIWDMVADASSLYVSDFDITRIDLPAVAVTNLTDGSVASFSGIDRDNAGNIFFTGGLVWKLAAGSTTPTDLNPILGDNSPSMGTAAGLKLDQNDNIYVADPDNHRVRYISEASGKIYTIAGNGIAGCPGSANSDARNVSFASPTRLAFDSSGNLYVADPACQQIYKLTPIPKYKGSVDSVACQSISGWAADLNRLNHPITVSIYDGTTLLATVTADQPRADVGAAIGEIGNHGYSFALPSSVKNGTAHSIHVVYETSKTEVTGSPKSLTCATGYTGFIDTASCSGGFSGWAADLSRLNQPLTVSLWSGSTLIASTTAKSARSDVGAAIGDNGNHGFSLAIPTAYANGQPQSFQVRFENSTNQLAGSPVTLTCGIAAPRYAGFVDVVSCAGGIAGWAADRNHLNQPISVTLWDGTTQIGSTSASGSRPDVGEALGDNGLHGFSLTLPASHANGTSHTLQVHFESSATQLSSSPVTLTCGSSIGNTQYAGWVDSSSCTRISGWVADKNRLNAPITVSLWNGPSQIASVTANGSRADVGAVLGDSGLHGFSLPVPSLVATGMSVPLQVHFESSGVQVPGASTTLTCGSSSGQNYTGWVDTLSCTTINGWAADRNTLNTSISVGIYDGSTLLATVAAASSRPDVGAVLGDSGLHGFSLATPASVKDGNAHTITLRPGTSSTALTGSQTLTCH